MPVLGDTPVHGIFIRAPIVERVGCGRGCAGPTRGRTRRGRPAAQRHGHGLPSRAGRRDALPPPAGDHGRRASTSPAEGSGRRPHPTRQGRRDDGATDAASRPMTGRSPRGARPGERPLPPRLTRPGRPRRPVATLARAGAPDDASVRSLGLPVTASHVSVFSLFRMPLGAFQPHDQLYVYEEDRPTWPGCCAWSATAIATSGRSWSSTPSTQGEAGDIRFRLVQHLLRDGSRARRHPLPRGLR